MSESVVVEARPIPADPPPAEAAGAGPVRAAGFHCFVEPLLGEAAGRARNAGDLAVLEIPEGVSFLASAAESAGSGVGGRALPLAVELAEPCGPALALEPLAIRGRDRLLVLNPDGLRARLNGRPLPAVALLRVGDELLLETLAVLHITRWGDGGLSRPAPELVGTPCGICRLPLAAETTVYVCSCGLALHLEGDSKPESERLECALFGDCPSCGAEVRLERGFVFEPEL